MVLHRELDHLFFSSFSDPPKDGSKSSGMSIEKKIEFLESLTGKSFYSLQVNEVTNRRSRRWLNDRLLMELVPSLNADEIRGLFAPPPWGDEVPPSTFSLTNIEEWDKFRNIDMDKEVNIINSLENSLQKRKGHIDADKMTVLNGWHRIDCRTRDALRRSSLPELIDNYEDPFHRLLLHGVCEFYNLASDTVTDYKCSKMTKIKKKKKGSPVLPNITLSHFLKMTKEGSW
ncbi:uncharacterized protein HKW66_Vig0250590 [Vigna angularis]|uniref:R3H-associated N-terminal domain-containing protein n=1 Tax=Phaseolus angularis TaxID=3914 RepID=A0A8T0KU83_PHAAN|nr:uncharacterized protein HKW66_Vig0250590 [Vigna angularis]